MTHIRNADLNLLEALAILLEERHVSRAADRFHLSQSAMSRTLQRLRDTFGDELLVRMGNGYEPTSRGHRIQAELADILPRLEALLRGDVFDPATATGEFRVQCADHATALLGPGVVQRVFRAAPQLSLRIAPWSGGSFADVAQGRADLAVSEGTAPEAAVPGPLHRELLFEEELVCLLADDHPLSGRRLTAADCLRQPHAIVTAPDGERTAVERRLAELGVRRPAGVRVPSLSAAVAALPGTALIAVLPRRVALAHAEDPAYRVAEAPVELRPLAYELVWHPRMDADPAHRWLRGLVREAAEAVGAAEAEEAEEAEAGLPGSSV
ncbi:LysR family transcriptional regulator [Streptomyces jumonjinensis]|uniref:LysR family transcriptional regulator n=1 Tax=Streptomyces jumonjinensis TaxID=1945 RepID=UPI0037BD3DEE